MTRFLKMADDKLINADQIVRIEEGGRNGSRGLGRSSGTLRDGIGVTLAAPANLVENEGCAIAVLYAGGVDDHAQRQAFGIDQGMQLAALHLLCGVVTPRHPLHPRLAAPLFTPLSATGCR